MAEDVQSNEYSDSTESQRTSSLPSSLLDTTMLSAVANFLSKRRQSHKAENDSTSNSSPLLVLTSMPEKESLLANVILGATTHTDNGSRNNQSIVPSFEQVHALATANLLASTQRDIAKQLAQQEEETDLSLELASSLAKSKRKEGPDSSLNKTKDQNEEPKPARVIRASSQSVRSEVNGMKKQQTEPRALICSFEGCKRKFAWQNHLKYHELTHTNDRKFKCPDASCGKSFFTAQRLDVHLRVHTGERPFRCDYKDCGKTFTTAGNLKNHQRIHTGEQPYVCDVSGCNRRFTEQSSLRKHKLIHSGDKPFQCHICGKRFTQSGSRSQHLLRHHLNDQIRASIEESRARQRDEDDDDEDEEESRPDESSSANDNLQQSQRYDEPENDEDASSVSKVESRMEVKPVSCSPQVLVLSNTYPGLESSDSVVFSHGLSDHIVTVSSQPVDRHISDGDVIPLNPPLLSHEDESMYRSYSIDQEEVTHTDYVGSDLTSYHNGYPQHEDVGVHTSEFPHDRDQLSSNQINLSSDPTSGMASSGEYVPTNCLHHVVSSAFSDTNLEPDIIAHNDFIGAEEVAIAHHCSIPDSADLLQDDNVAGCEEITIHRSKTDSNRGYAANAAISLQEPSVSLGGSYMTSNAMSEVRSHSPSDLSHARGDQEIHMDPMMECDEEPEKQKAHRIFL